MLKILAITGPIYVAIAFGYVMTRLGVFNVADMRALGKYVIYIALPALLFKAMAQGPIAENLNGAYLLVYSIGSLAVLGIGWLWGRRVMRLRQTDAAFLSMGMMCSNSAFVGYPVLLLVVAPVAGMALALNVIVENIVALPLLLALAEHGRDQGPRDYRVIGRSIRALARNPLILAVAAGIGISLVGTKLPEPVVRTISLFAASSGAVSLIVIGGTLVGVPVTGVGRRVAPIAIGKLILHPIAVLLAAQSLPLIGGPAMIPSLRLAAVLSAAMPMFGVYPILAQAYQAGGTSAAALLITTSASFVTLSGLLWALSNMQS
jgi:malonate transporter